MGEDMMDYHTVGIISSYTSDGRIPDGEIHADTKVYASVTADSQWEAVEQANWLVDTREGNKLLFGDSSPSEINSDVVQGGLEASS